jgi:ketosteroid isomerase-like protein
VALVAERRFQVADDSSSIELVRTYIAAVQRARASGDVDDFEALREFLAPDVVIKVASPWTDQPWHVMHRGADALIARLQAPINKATSLTTENVTVQQAGDDVYVEQVSTIVDDDGSHVSMVCHIFSVVDGLITGVRGYRNERGIPPG